MLRYSFQAGHSLVHFMEKSFPAQVRINVFFFLYPAENVNVFLRFKYLHSITINACPAWFSEISVITVEKFDQ